MDFLSKILQGLGLQLSDAVTARHVVDEDKIQTRINAL
jgi:hypothetical protein